MKSSIPQSDTGAVIAPFRPSAPVKSLGAISRMLNAGAILNVAALAVFLLALLPLVFVAGVAVQTGWETTAALIFRPRVGELLLNTFLLELVTLPICAVLAVALAWLNERSNLPGHRFWSWLSVAPLAIPAFVHSYSWVTAIPSIQGLWGGVLVSTLAYFPFLYLPVAAALRRLDPGYEEAAAALGVSPLRVMLTVVLPQLRLPLCGGALLIGLHLLAEYGLFVMIRFDTFTTAIVDQFQSSYNGPAASVLAGVLAILCLALLTLESSARGSARYARVGSGSSRLPLRKRLGWYTIPALVFCAAIAGLSLGVPLMTLGRWLLIGGMDVWRVNELWPAISQTALLGFAGALATTLLAFPMAWLSIRAPSKFQRLLESAYYIVGALPGVVVALALVTVTVAVAMPLYQTLFTALLAYVLLFLPRALVGLRTGIAQAPIELEQVAQSLGYSPARALWATTVRLTAPSAAAGFAMVFLGISNELTATLLLAPNGTQTLATTFWAYSSEIDYAAAAPYAALMVLLSLPMTILLHKHSRRIAGR